MSTLLRCTLYLCASLLVACDRDDASTTTTGADAARTAAPPPLLARDLLFGNPQRANGQLSPDGRWVGYVAPRDGVMNVYVAASGEPSSGRPVTNDRLRGIRGYNFAA